MHQSINKYRLYLYLFFFIFLSSIINLQFLEIYKNKFLIKQINIIGLPINEKKIIENELKNFKNTNIFELNEDKILRALNKFNFLDKIYVRKIIPSTINIDLSKTSILGKTFVNQENLYVGKNGKFIKSNQVFETKNVSTIYGDFNVKEFLELINILNNNRLDINKIREYYYFKNKRWDLLFYSGVTLKLPSQNIDESIKIYKNLSDNINLIDKKIIDLRVLNQIILTNNNG